MPSIEAIHRVGRRTSGLEIARCSCAPIAHTRQARRSEFRATSSTPSRAVALIAVFRLLRDGEEPLCASMRAESEVYRFAWHGSFDGAAVVRIGRQRDKVYAPLGLSLVPGAEPGRLAPDRAADAGPIGLGCRRP